MDQSKTRSTSKELVFPVIRSSKDGTIGVAMNNDELTTTNPLAIKNGYFDGLRITAADGKRFVVRAVKRLATKKPWWRLPELFETLITVGFELEPNGAV